MSMSVSLSLSVCVCVCVYILTLSCLCAYLCLRVVACSALPCDTRKETPHFVIVPLNHTSLFPTFFHVSITCDFPRTQLATRHFIWRASNETMQFSAIPSFFYFRFPKTQTRQHCTSFGVPQTKRRGFPPAHPPRR